MLVHLRSLLLPALLRGGAIVLASRRPAEDQLVSLDDAPFISTELDHDVASTWLHELDAVGAFDAVYHTLGEWKAAIPALVAKISNPALILLWKRILSLRLLRLPCGLGLSAWAFSRAFRLPTSFALTPR